MNTVLVQPDGLLAPEGPDGRRPLRGDRLHVAIAVIGGLVAAGALLFLADRPAVAPRPPHERLIQAHLDVWYGGDFETAQSLRAPERLRTGPSEERARSEVEYQAILGAGAELLGCEELPPATIRCDVAYSNALNEAVGEAPAIVAQQFGMQDGLLLFVAGPYLEDEEITASFRDFATERFPDEYDDVCVEEPNYQPPSCAELKLRHLDRWAAWHRIDRG